MNIGIGYGTTTVQKMHEMLEPRVTARKNDVHLCLKMRSCKGIISFLANTFVEWIEV